MSDWLSFAKAVKAVESAELTANVPKRHRKTKPGKPGLNRRSFLLLGTLTIVLVCHRSHGLDTVLCACRFFLPFKFILGGQHVNYEPLCEGSLR